MHGNPSINTEILQSTRQSFDRTYKDIFKIQATHTMYMKAFNMIIRRAEDSLQG